MIVGRSGRRVYLVMTFCEQVADLQDFTDLPIDDSLPLLYQGALKQLDEHGIPCRTLRTELTSCESDIEYLCKLHCVRLSCQVLFRNEEALSWFASAGRSLLSNLITLADKVREITGRMSEKMDGRQLMS